MFTTQGLTRQENFRVRQGFTRQGLFKGHDTDLCCEEGTRGNISHGKKRNTTLFSGHKNQTRRRNIRQRKKMLHRDKDAS